MHDPHQAARFAAHMQQLLAATKQPSTALIVAVDTQGGFSKDGKIPWSHKSDLAHFKRITDGHICVMGRATYESLPVNKKHKSILPGRKCFVLTSSPLPRKDAIAIASFNDIFKHYVDEDWNKTIFFIGGERVYLDAINRVDTAYVTVVNVDANCDKFLPMDWILNTFDLIKNTVDTKTPELRFLEFARKRTRT